MNNDAPMDEGLRAELTLLTPQQVCELMQVKLDWIYDNCAAGNIPHVRLGRTIRFRPADLRAYLDGTWRK